MNIFVFGLMALCAVMAEGKMIGIPGPVPDFYQMDGFDGDLAAGKWYGQYYSNKGIPPLPIHCWSFISTPGANGSIDAEVTLYAPMDVKSVQNIHVTPIPGEKAKFVMDDLTKGPLTTTMVIPYTDNTEIFIKIDQFQINNPEQMHAYSINVYYRKPEKDEVLFEKVKQLLAERGITDELTYVPQECPEKSLQDKFKGMFGF